MTHVDELPDEEVWVASGGVRIPLVKMSDKHLRNATNHMRKALTDTPSEDEEALEDMTEKIDKLEGEVARRLNDDTGSTSPKSLPITQARQDAEDAYRRMGR